MELVYVWIEEYKNIKNQGFNLSPNHEFELIKKKDGKYILENKMIGEDGKSIAKNFFGENISNITAIIGKNGSGKSSLIEAITRFSKSEGNVKFGSRILIFKDKDTFYYYQEKVDIDSPSYYELEEKSLEIKEFANKENGLDIIYYDNIILKKPWLSQAHSKIQNISSQRMYLLDEKRSLGNSPLNIFASSETRRNIIFLRSFNKDEIGGLKDAINLHIKFPKVCYLKFVNSKKVKEWNDKLIEYVSSIIVKNMEKILIARFKQIGNEFKESYQKLLQEQLSSYQESDFINFEEYIKNSNLKKLEKLTEEKSKINIPYIQLTKGIPLEGKNKSIGKKYFEYVKHFYKFLGIGNKESENKIKFVGKGRIEVKLNGDKIDDLIEFLKGVDENPVPERIIDYQFDIEMSSGERAFLGLFSRFYSVIEKIDKKNVLIVMDEPEMFMHPEWQRKFINIFIKFSESIFPNKKIQIITTSHSPFMASDLPRENIIMLETYTKDDKETKLDEKDDTYQNVGDCKIKNKKDLKTFGANIHELYKESFFMDSTMGEFALSKIKEVIEDLTTLECFKREEDLLKKLKEKTDLNDQEEVKKKLLEDHKEMRETKEIEIRGRQGEIKYIIDQIGERVLSRKLGEKYRELFGEEEKIEDKMKNLYSNLDSVK